jgi:hypothetical protein
MLHDRHIALGMHPRVLVLSSRAGRTHAEFYVLDGNSQVKDPKKIAAINKVLNVNFELEDAHLAATGALRCA